MLKSSEAFRTISEVADALVTPAHVLRFWESRFAQIKPVKRAGGRRYYRPADVALLGGIRKLLHEDGLTIRGVQKILKEKGVRHVAALMDGTFADDLTDDAYAAAAARPVSGPAAGTSQPGPSVRPPPAASPFARPMPSSPFGIQHPVDQLMMPMDDAGEAPMLLDAPALPLGPVANLRPRSEAARPAAAASEPARDPAATLLRAMDALRARDKRSELRDVYNRLTSLRERLSRRSEPGPR